MKYLAGLLILILAWVTEANGGAHEEIKKLMDGWVRAYEAGETQKLASLYAEDAELIPARLPFRLEGKEAIETHLAGIFQTFKDRRLFLRQPATRVYNKATVAVTAGYYETSLVDHGGKISRGFGRYTFVWVRFGQRWQIVSQSTSPLPLQP